MAALIGTFGSYAEITRGYLQAKPWSVEKIAAKTEFATRAAFISFKPDGKLSGTGGCNRFVGLYDYNPADSYLTIRNLGRTRKLCARKLMQQERQIMNALHAASALKELPGKRLVLIDKNGAELIWLK